MKNGLIIDELGNKLWYKNDLLHREDGPAIEYANEYKAWYYQCKLHRVDGPTYEYANGYKECYYQGQQINCKTQQEFEKLIKLRLFW